MDPLKHSVFYIGQILGGLLVVYGVLMASSALLTNRDGFWQGDYWGIMNVVGSLIVGGVGFMIAKGCGRALRRPPSDSGTLPPKKLTETRGGRPVIISGQFGDPIFPEDMEEPTEHPESKESYDARILRLNRAKDRQYDEESKDAIRLSLFAITVATCVIAFAMWLQSGS